MDFFVYLIGTFFPSPELFIVFFFGMYFWFLYLPVVFTDKIFRENLKRSYEKTGSIWLKPIIKGKEEK